MRMRPNLAVIMTSILAACILAPAARSQEAVNKEAEELADQIVTNIVVEQQEKAAIVREHLDKGISLYRQDKFKDALEEFRIVEKMDPGNRDASSYVARCIDGIDSEGRGFFKDGVRLYKRGEYAGAKEAFSGVPEENSKFEEAKQYLLKVEEGIQAELEKQQEREAREEAEKSAEKRDEMFRDGKRAYSDGDYDEAIGTFEKLLAVDPGDENTKAWKRKVERAKESRETQLTMREVEKDKAVALKKKELQEKKALLEVDNAYAPSKKKEEIIMEARPEPGMIEDEQKIKEMEDRLKRIKVPALQFRDANIREVIEQLMTLTGVNIVLDEGALRAAGGESVASAAVAPAAPPGMPGREPGYAPAPVEEALPAGIGGMTLNFRTVAEMPLLDVLEVALAPVNFGYQIKSSYVWITDARKIGMGGKLVTRYYKLKYGIYKPKKFEIKEFEKRIIE